LLTLFIRPQDWAGSPLYGLPLNQVSVWGGLIAGVINQSKAGRDLKTPHTFLIIAFVLLSFISNAVHGDAGFGFSQCVAFFKRFLVYVMFLLLLDSPKKVKQTFFIIMVFTVILSFQAIYQSQHGGMGWAHQILHTSGNLDEKGNLQIPVFDGRTFWIGLWDGPNVLCLAYLIAVPFCFGNIIKKGKSFVYKFINLFSVGMLVFGIYLTNSRGGFLSLGAMILLFVVFRFGVKKGIILAMVCLPLFLIFSPSRMKELNSKEDSAHERTWTWERGLRMAKENPVFGIGRGKFPLQTGLVAHNNYVSSMSETGYFGLLLYIALVYLTIKSCFVVYRATALNDDEIKDLSLSVVIAAIGFFFATFFVLMEHDVLFVFWALTATCYVLARSEFKDLKLEFNLRDWINSFGITCGVIILIWLIAEKEIF